MVLVSYCFSRFVFFYLLLCELPFYVPFLLPRPDRRLQGRPRTPVLPRLLRPRLRLPRSPLFASASREYW